MDDKNYSRYEFAKEMKERIEEIRKKVEDFCDDYNMRITIETYISDDGVSTEVDILV